jgi:PBSX family phage terminase large subunit
MDNFDRDSLDEIADMVREAQSANTNKVNTRGRPKKIKEDGTNKRTVIVTKPQAEFLSFVDNRTEPVTDMYELLFSGSVGAGKSSALILMILKYAMVPNSTCLLLHQHLQSIKKTSLPLMIKGSVTKDGQFMPPLLPPACIKSFNKSEGILVLHNGSNIILSGVQDSEKLKSINASMAVIDEVTNLKKEDYFSIVQRCRIYHPLHNGVFSACNPGNKNSWVYRHFFEDSIPNYRQVIQVNSMSNRANLPDSYLQTLNKLPEHERKRMYLGEWCNTGRGVFDCFDTHKHTKDLSRWDKNDYQNYYLSNDLGGGSANKYSATLLLAEDNGIFYVLDELSQLKTSHSDVIKWLKQYYDLTKLVSYDPANAIFGTELENEEFVAIKPDKNIEFGVAKINSMFADGRLVISTRCQGLIKELEDCYRNEETGKWDKNGQKCDLADALRYGVVAFDDKSTIDKYNKPTGNVFCFSL